MDPLSERQNILPCFQQGMDSKKTKEELIALCKEQGIKGYSGKKKADILLLLDKKPIEAPIATLIETKNVSPLRYPGGKTRAIAILSSYVSTYFPTKKVLLSPFFGGGSFELFMTTKGYTVHGNDLFVPLYTFWTTKQSNCDTLAAAIKEHMPVTKDKFHQLRASILKEEAMKVATSYFIINRTSFSGATLCGGYSQQAAEGRLTESSIEKLKACDVRSITFTNLDCNVFLTQHPETTDTLVYADPPYYIDTYIYGKNGDMHENFNHAAFADTIKKRSDWIVSYNDCEYIRELYKDCRIFEAKWSYGMNAKKASSEIIILPLQ
jgi:DNA adenine methylase